MHATAYPHGPNTTDEAPPVTMADIGPFAVRCTLALTLAATRPPPSSSSLTSRGGGRVVCTRAGVHPATSPSHALPASRWRSRRDVLPYTGYSERRRNEIAPHGSSIDKPWAPRARDRLHANSERS